MDISSDGAFARRAFTRGEEVERGVVRRLPENFEGDEWQLCFTWSDEVPNRVWAVASGCAPFYNTALPEESNTKMHRTSRRTRSSSPPPAISRRARSCSTPTRASLSGDASATSTRCLFHEPPPRRRWATWHPTAAASMATATATLTSLCSEDD